MKRLREKMFIYALVNPLDEKVFYVGQSKNVYVRVLEHINKSHLNKTPKDKVLTDLFKNGLMPKYEILEEIDINLSDKSSSLVIGERERFWINKYSEDGWVSNKQLNPKTEKLDNPHFENISCSYCGKETQAKTTRKRFCSTLCRVYYAREKERGTLEPPKIIDDILTTEINKPVSEKTPPRYYEPPKMSEHSEYDFTGVVYLNVEHFTKFPESSRPKTMGEVIDWQKKRDADVANIKTAWNNWKKQTF